jgi:hypothetical protein
MSEKFWFAAWPLISLCVALFMNFLTRSPLFDLTTAHILIAGVVGLLLTAVFFGIVESILFIARLLSTDRSAADHRP